MAPPFKTLCLPKDRLRKQIALVKKNLSCEEVRRQSHAMVRRLKDWPAYRASQTILFYAPLKKEVQIHSLIRDAIARKKTVCLPVCNHKTGRMKPYVIQSLKDLKEGPYGIRQPSVCPSSLVKQKNLDLVFIPGIAFDLEGNRLGRGKGYYDRFLKRGSTKTVKVGVALSQQIVPVVPVHKSDVPMDYLTYARGIVCCKKRSRYVHS